MGYIGQAPANKVVTSADIEDGVVSAADLGANSVDSSELVDGSIDTSHLSADAVDGTKLADDAVNSEHYTDASIDNAHIADGAVDTQEIADNAITLAKMASGTDGNIISYDASGDPVAIATGSDGQVLTSTGAGSPPAFEAVAAGGQYQLLQTTYDSTTTGSLALTGCGFQPKFIYLWYNNGSWVDGRVGMGMADGTGTYDMYSFNDGNKQTSDSWKFTTGNVQDHIYSSSNYSYLVVASLDSDGVTFTKSKYGSPSGTIAIQVACFG